MSEDIGDELAKEICTVAGVVSCCLMTNEGSIIAMNGTDKQEEFLTLNQIFVDLHTTTVNLGMGETASCIAKTRDGQVALIYCSGLSAKNHLHMAVIVGQANSTALVDMKAPKMLAAWAENL
ncbi:MAG: hypothetical protein ABFR97_08340 [Thermodesulfobacteriota bacterium]